MSSDRTSPAHEILVATDFSQTSDAAVAVAHAYARALGGRLYVFHITWPGELGLTDLFARLVKELGPSVPVVVASHGGDAAEEILRYARQHAIDLIVLGTHGRTGVTRALLGSVAERVIRTAPCPVLTVPPGAAPLAPTEAAPPIAAHRCVVCSKESPDLICEPCRIRIRGEALHAKQQAERPGRA
jgi:nucleotide-binding universal stress UspA family protein